jgi:dTDP-4-dehydrorhamnose 3,5-epimerase
VKITALSIPDVKLIEPNVINDKRGVFLESYSVRSFKQAGIECAFVQDNYSLSINAGVIRGLHFQLPPFAQAKLIWVTKGRIWDVALDLRGFSPTYGQYTSIELSHKAPQMLYIPVGFAHGFVSMEPNCEVQYKADNYYAPDHDAGILWSDPDIAIDWPIKNNDVILSDKDAALPAFADLQNNFDYLENENPS